MVKTFHISNVERDFVNVENVLSCFTSREISS